MGKLLFFVIMNAAVYLASAAPSEAPAAGSTTEAAATEAAAKAATETAAAATATAADAGSKATEAAKDAKEAVTEATKEAAEVATTQASKVTPGATLDTFAPSTHAANLVDAVNTGVYQTYAGARQPMFDLLTGLTRLITGPLGAPLSILGMQNLPKEIVEGGIGMGMGLSDNVMGTGYKVGAQVGTGVRNTAPLLAPITTMEKQFTNLAGGAFKPLTGLGNMFQPLQGQ